MKKIALALALGFCALAATAAQSDASEADALEEILKTEESPRDFERRPLSLYITTDFAYYPESDFKSGKSHFAPITSAYEKLEFRTTLFADYAIPLALGEHWLLKDSRLTLQGFFELSLISARPGIAVEFSPLPFLALKSGASFGLGWNVLGFEGVCRYDENSGEYKELATGKNSYYDFWTQATLMFDTGAIFSGDWSHVVMLANFKILYSGLTGIGRHEIFEWQGTMNQVQGLQYEAAAVIAYQMPLALYRAGMMFSVSGHFDGADYGLFDKNYNGSFAAISFSPFVQLKLGKRDELYILTEFSSRRSFAQSHSKIQEEPRLDATGREWYFRRLAFSWTHRF